MWRESYDTTHEKSVHTCDMNQGDVSVDDV